MERNPYNRDSNSRFKGAAAAISATLLLFFAIAGFNQVSLFAAASLALITISLLSVTAYFYWYISGFLAAFQAKSLAALIIVSLIVSATYAISDASGIASGVEFRRYLPIISVITLLIWIIIVMDYRLASDRDSIRDSAKRNEEPVYDPKRAGQISVKDGNRIDIIKFEDILTIQANGDYSIITTESGKFVKEQTMKSFEQILPNNFVRVHRSYIINSQFITRAELFGKESYNIYIKNGDCIRASLAGYKLLKDRLFL